MYQDTSPIFWVLTRAFKLQQRFLTLPESVINFDRTFYAKWTQHMIPILVYVGSLPLSTGSRVLPQNITKGHIMRVSTVDIPSLAVESVLFCPGDRKRDKVPWIRWNEIGFSFDLTETQVTALHGERILFPIHIHFPTVHFLSKKSSCIHKHGCHITLQWYF